MDLDIELLALLKHKGGGSSVTVEPLTVTVNGTTTAPEGKAYSPVTVAVQPPLGYLTFSNIAYLSVTDPVWDGTMYISDDAEQWSEWDGTRFEPGDSHTIYLQGSGNTKVSNNGHSFTFDAYDSNEGGVTCEGNIENLLDAATVARGEHPTMKANCYACMFKDCTSLIKAPKLSAIALTLSCYLFMFQGCTSLVTAPALPATTLALSCYQSMFQGCTSLTTAPDLPATTITSSCYQRMFQGCTNLTTAPSLPATQLTTYCYYQMFQGCTSLTTAPALPATTVNMYCYYQMFQGCTSLTTLPALPATTLDQGCYDGMFDGCTGIKLSTTNTGEYITSYRIPVSGTGTTAKDALTDMFTNTGGTFTGTPTINTTYYTSNAIPELTQITENGVHNVAQYTYATVDVQPPLGYLTFSNIATISVTDPVWDGTMYISDDAERWIEWDGTSFTPNSSHMVYLRGSGNTVISSSGHSFTFEAYDSTESGVTCTGNIENLLDAEAVAQGEHPEMAADCYRFMFYGCTKLTSAPALPATTLAVNCYNGMFYGCTKLTTAPDLPATTIVSGCYSFMFYGCTSLITAPALPATTLANDCYYSMFFGCTSLVAAPSLPATTLASQCYYSMFQGCTKLITLPALPATSLKTFCYSGMFYGCKLIKLSTTNDGDYTTPYRIPVFGTGTGTASISLSNMFYNTGGAFTGTPTINTTYYTSNAVPELTKITTNGMHNVAQYTYADVDVQPTLQSKTVTENGTVTADSGYDGLASVVVDVPSPALNPLSVTANGTYTPASGTGYGTVTVNVPVPSAYDGTVVVV